MVKSENTLSVDVGFGYEKAIYNSPKNRIQFPSIVKKVAAFENSIIGGSEDYQVSIKEEKDSEITYAYVGVAGLTHRGTRRWEDKGALDIESIKLLVCTAAVLLDAASDSNLCVGLPLSYYNDLEIREKLRNAFRSMKAFVKVGKKEKEVCFSDIKVYAQGAGAYFSSLFNIDGTIKDEKLLSESIAIIDIGFRTFDYLYVVMGENGHVSLSELCGSLEEYGMNRALQITAKNINTKYSASVSANEVEKAIFWNSYSGKLKNPDVAIAPYFEAAKKELVQEIVSELGRKWQDSVKDLAAIIVTGGGGVELFELIKEQFPKAVLQNDANFANAVGYATKYNLQKALKKGI